MQKLYTTPEAAKVTGIPESTIRSWMRRHPEVFQLDIHVIAEESGRKLWTEAGIELLRSRIAPDFAPDNSAELDAENSANELLEALLEHDARVLAVEYWRQLPGRVLHRIKLMQQNPTPEDRQIVQTAKQAALNTGTSHLLLPIYRPMLLRGGDEQADE
jgi:hypothetical protein